MLRAIDIVCIAAVPVEHGRSWEYLFKMISQHLPILGATDLRATVQLDTPESFASPLAQKCVQTSHSFVLPLVLKFVL